jgi:hypothetical protein
MFSGLIYFFVNKSVIFAIFNEVIVPELAVEEYGCVVYNVIKEY